MANKRYDQFAAGTYNTAKIFLQADAATGALEKVFLPPRGIWGEITGTLSAQSDLNAALAGKEPTITAGTSLQYWRGDKVFATLNTAAVPELTNLYFTDARARAAISLTTTGTSGASTYNNTTGVLNVPNYATGGSPAGSTTEIQFNNAGAFGASSTFAYAAAPTISGGIGKAFIVNPTVTATANNNTLSGLHLTPTISIGAFTGVKNYGINLTAATVGVQGTSLWVQDSNGSVGPSIALSYNANPYALISFSTSGIRLEYRNNSTGAVTLTPLQVTLNGNTTITHNSSSLNCFSINGNSSVVADDGIKLNDQGPTNTSEFGIKWTSGATNIAKIVTQVGATGTANQLIFYVGNPSHTLTEVMRMNQNQNMLIGTATDTASAILKLESTTKAFLPPRMTTTQKNAIASPVNGMVVHDTTLQKLCVYTTAWEIITSV